MWRIKKARAFFIIWRGCNPGLNQKSIPKPYNFKSIPFSERNGGLSFNDKLGEKHSKEGIEIISIVFIVDPNADMII